MADTKALPTERRYDIQVVKLGGKQIAVETVKITEKQENEELLACQQVQPYAKVFGKKSYEIQLSGIDTEYKLFFNRLQKNQEKIAGDLAMTLPNMQIYNYTPNSGKLRLDYNLLGCAIEEISKENGVQFDVKLSAINRKFETNVEGLYPKGYQ